MTPSPFKLAERNPKFRIQSALLQLATFTPEMRCTLFGLQRLSYCPECGIEQSRERICQCANDE